MYLYLCICIYVFVFAYLYLFICICVVVFVYLYLCISAPGQAVDLQLEQRWWVGWEFEYFAFCKERRCPRLIFEHTVTQAQGKNDRKWGNKPFIYKIFPLQGQCTCVCIVVTFGRWCFLSLIRARQCGVKRRGRVVRCEGTLCVSRQLWMEASTLLLPLSLVSHLHAVSSVLANQQETWLFALF